MRATDRMDDATSEEKGFDCRRESTSALIAEQKSSHTAFCANSGLWYMQAFQP